MNAVNALPPPIPGLVMAGLIVAAVCAVLCWVYVAIYAPVKDKGTYGRHMFRMGILFGLMFTLTVGFALLPPKSMFWLVTALVAQLLVFVAAAAELAFRVYLLVDAQIDGAAERIVARELAEEKARYRINVEAEVARRMLAVAAEDARASVTEAATSVREELNEANLSDSYDRGVARKAEEIETTASGEPRHEREAEELGTAFVEGGDDEEHRHGAEGL